MNLLKMSFVHGPQSWRVEVGLVSYTMVITNRCCHQGKRVGSEQRKLGIIIFSLNPRFKDVTQNFLAALCTYSFMIKQIFKHRLLQDNIQEGKHKSGRHSTPISRRNSALN